MKVTLGGHMTYASELSGEQVPLGYAQAKEIALLRQDLRACWNAGDTEGAETALARLSKLAGDDSELVAEAHRWAIKLAA